MKPIVTKLAWAGFVLTGAPFVYLVAPGKGEWIHASAVIAVGLAMFFFAGEPRQDERIDQLKLKAVKASFIAALNFTLIMNMVVLNRSEPDVVTRSLSAFDFAAIAMLCSLLLFYYWCWQDAQPAKEP